MYSTGIFYEDSGTVIKVWVTAYPSHCIKEPFTEGEFKALDSTTLNSVKERLKAQLISKLNGEWLNEEV